MDDQHFAVDGTPTDCVLLAINHVLKDHKPDLVLSGVNHGGNMGEDVTYSGTIAAAMEATLLGVPAIAMSLFLEGTDTPFWETAERWAPDVVAKATATSWQKNVLVNVNFPAVPPDRVTGIKVVRHGKRKIGDNLTERVDPRGRAYFWIGAVRGEEDIAEDTDIHVIKAGGIAVTPLYLDLTHYPTLDPLTRAFTP